MSLTCDYRNRVTRYALQKSCYRNPVIAGQTGTITHPESVDAKLRGRRGARAHRLNARSLNPADAAQQSCIETKHSRLMTTNVVSKLELAWQAPYPSY